MTRRSYVFCKVQQKLVPKEEYYGVSTTNDAPAVFGDNEVFISPIDHKEYSGRAALREHNKRHDVVSNRDLKGLPVYKSNSDVRSVQEKRQHAQERKELIIHQVNKHFR
jgi:hypothetical protein